MAELQRRKQTSELEASLTEFLKSGWRYIDPSPYVPGWHLDAIAEHLEAVTRGEIRRLLINVPPRTSKSSMVSVAWPAWTWCRADDTPLSGPQVQFLFASYAQSLSLRDSVKMRRLVESPWYQKQWGSRFVLTSDQNTKIRFENDRGGYRLATSVGGALTGEGAGIIVCDDPHNAVEMESETVRRATLAWWDESLSTRLNDPKTGAFVVIMQRLHEEDLSGHILSRQEGDWTHLCLPMRFDPSRRCETDIGFTDPRKEDGELLCPERFGEKEVSDLESRLGPFAAAGQLDQAPTPRGGGIIKKEWWQPWTEDHYPACELVIASLDTAYTEKEENDASALTIWGLFRGGGERAAKDYPGLSVPGAAKVRDSGAAKLILMYAWEGRLELHDLVVGVNAVCSRGDLDPDESDRVRQLMKLQHMPRFPVDKLLIEAKASGISVSQELQRLYGGRGEYSVELIDPSIFGDKVARMYAVQPTFSSGLVYAPDRSFADRAIDRVAAFPKSAQKDLADTVSQALRYMRETGLLSLPEEHSRQVSDSLMYRPKPRPLY